MADISILWAGRHPHILRWAERRLPSELSLTERERAVQEWLGITVVCSISVLKVRSLQPGHSSPRVGCVPHASSSLWWLLAELGTQASGRESSKCPRDQGSIANIFSLLIFTICNHRAARESSAPGLAPSSKRPGQGYPHSHSQRRLHPPLATCPLFCSRNCFSPRRDNRKPSGDGRAWDRCQCLLSGCCVTLSLF